MPREVTVKLHVVAVEGPPPAEGMTGRRAFVLAGGEVYAGWPLLGVTHCLEFPTPVWDLVRT